MELELHSFSQDLRGCSNLMGLHFMLCDGGLQREELLMSQPKFLGLGGSLLLARSFGQFSQQIELFLA
jgi:hypothetical protein